MFSMGQSFELVTMGETMCGMVPSSSGPLRYEREFHPCIAGAESNLAIGMAKLGHSATWISRLGDDELGHYVNNMIRAEGVDVSGVVFDGAHRTGVMFKERSAGETRVFYYRENSAASHMTPGDIDESLIASARVVHLTGITPVLSPGCAEAVVRMFDLAAKNNVPVSFDPNVRKKLWKDNDYAPLLKELTLRASIVLLGIDEAEEVLGLSAPEDIFDALLGDGAATMVAIKNGSEGAWVADASCRRHIPPIQCVCIEPIGAGDAFNAGFLSGWLEGKDVTMCGRMGAIAGGLATQVTGDIEGYPDKHRMRAMLEHVKEVYR